MNDLAQSSIRTLPVSRGPPKTPEGRGSIPRVRSGNTCVKASQEDILRYADRPISPRMEGCRMKVRSHFGGMTPYPGQEWMEQRARNATMEEWGFLRGCRYLLHDRDTKFCASFRELIGKCQNDSLASEEPQLEFVCGALGEIGQRGMPVEADSVCAPHWTRRAKESTTSLGAASRRPTLS
jgi:hypothetical protein